MTKNHFIALADVFRDCKPLDVTFNNDSQNVGHRGRNIQWTLDMLSVAVYLSTFPNFNRELWMDYVNGKCKSNRGVL